ncbi:MAG: hypothetical protein K0S33_1014 [Bacteroidetes bacterium]|jgi:hypothetical protein|nr:hypothetical protein [Bacteroidota bacterium]
MEDKPIKSEKNNIPVKYTEAFNSFVNVIANILPFGNVIAEGLINYHGRIKQERLNLFVEKLREYMEQIHEDEINPEYLKSEDFLQLFESVIRKVVETRSEEKLSRYRDILVNNIKAQKSADYSETFLTLVSQLQEEQIVTLNNLNRYARESEWPKDQQDEWFGKFITELYNVPTQDLIAKGLIEMKETKSPGIKIWPMVTEYGKQFILFIRPK